MKRRLRSPCRAALTQEVVVFDGSIERPLIAVT